MIGSCALHVIGQELDDVAPLPSCSGTDWGRTLDVLIFVFVQWTGLTVDEPHRTTCRLRLLKLEFRSGSSHINKHRCTSLEFFVSYILPTLGPLVLKRYFCNPFCSAHSVMFLLHHIQMHKVPLGVREQHTNMVWFTSRSVTFGQV